jgi:hypothetical protein
MSEIFILQYAKRVEIKNLHLWPWIDQQRHNIFTVNALSLLAAAVAAFIERDRGENSSSLCLLSVVSFFIFIIRMSLSASQYVDKKIHKKLLL